MGKVFFIGSGRLAKNLANAFTQKGIKIAGVYSKTYENAQFFANAFQTIAFTNIKEIPLDCEVYFLAISDKEIAGFAQIFKVNGILVHCSGMMSLEILNKEKDGVFWPIQTFSNDYYVKLEDVPLCIESNSPFSREILFKLGSTISNKVVLVNEKERQKLHLAAVFVNNFTNHLYYLGSTILKKGEFEMLEPLIVETANKIKQLSPLEAQTGPAARKDMLTLQKHEALLKNEPHLLEIYRLLSISIIDNNV